MPIFGGSFLVIRSSDSQAVADALGLSITQNYLAEYPDRQAQRSGGPTWISRPIRDHILVTGYVPYDALDLSQSDPALAQLRHLSTQFGDAYLFGEDNGCPYCFYAWCRNGEIVRAYAIITDPECVVLWNQGEPQPAEQDYLKGMALLDSRHEGPIPHAEYSKWLPYEETTYELAEAWCVSPSSLTDREDMDCYGLGGKMKAPWPRPHNPSWATDSESPGRTSSAYEGDEDDDSEDEFNGPQRYTFQVSGGIGSVSYEAKDLFDPKKANAILELLGEMGVDQEQLKILRDAVEKRNDSNTSEQ